MPLDPARVAETREWLQKAAQDLREVRIDLEASPPLLEDALFHCQQSVEKAIKGYLSWHGVRFGKPIASRNWAPPPRGWTLP